MTDEPDGIDEAFEAALRVAVTVAGRMAEHAARAREQAARDTHAASQQEARELQARLEAERSAARAQLAPVERQDWWASADPQQIAAAWETAQAWQKSDPDARRAADRIRHEVHDRYGVDVDDPRPEAGALADALAARQDAEQDAQQQRRESRRDDVEAALLLREADHADRAQQPGAATGAEQDAGVLYDSAERRRELAASLEGLADSEAVEARVLADTAQGQPAALAATSPPATSGRRARGPVAGLRRGKQGLAR
jgi:hypothetical protein